MMLSILVNGCNGKMGQEVLHALDGFKNLSLFGGFDRENTGKYTFRVFTEVSELEKLEEVPDIIVDFSVPIATFTILEYAKQKHIPMVIATTGFTNEQKEQIQLLSEHLPIFQSANMSFHICLMSKLLQKVAQNLKDHDIEIIETHHNRKVDSPSGTALLLADKIKETLGDSIHYEFDRHAKHEKREKNEIGFSSIRGGNIVGEHTVKFFGEDESFEITHTSYSRRVFAEGALKACIFLKDKPNGYYTMDDLVQF